MQSALERKQRFGVNDAKWVAICHRLVVVHSIDDIVWGVSHTKEV